MAYGISSALCSETLSIIVFRLHHGVVSRSAIFTRERLGRHGLESPLDLDDGLDLEDRTRAPPTKVEV